MSNQIVISSGAKVRSLEGVLTGTAGIVNSVPLGGANGVATLDFNGKVPLSQLPASVVTYLGTWNAATNTPTLTNGVGDIGDLYICNVAGTVNFGAGPIVFAVGDWVIYNGSQWQKSAGSSGTVTSVAVSSTGNDAISITGSPVTTSGTINIGFTGTSAQYVNGAGDLTTFPSFVSSVGLTSTAPAFTITNSPITSSGNIGLNFSGNNTQYVAGDGSLITFPSVVTQAQNLISEVYNRSGATITKGTVVYINGGQGNLPTITKAIATSDATSAQTYGVVQADITNMNNGYVVVAGRLQNLDTQAYTEGTQLYLSSTTAGAWTSVKQYAPAHLVYVGIVVRSHPTQGVVEVKIQNGYELDELHNVSAQTPSNNQGLFYNSSNSLWENKSIATALGYTPADDSLVAKLAANQIFTGGNTFSNSTTTAFTYGISIEKGYTPAAFFSSHVTVYSETGYLTNNLIIRDANSKAKLVFNNSTQTFTFPAATGTIALTSDIPSLGGYVPYSGATMGLDLGTYSYNGNNVIINGNSSTQNGTLLFKQVGSLAFNSVGYTGIGILGTTAIHFNFNQSSGVYKQFNFDVTGLTNNTLRTLTIPNNTGTIALISDLSSYVPYTGATTNVDLGAYGLTTTSTLSANSIYVNGAGSSAGVVLLKQATGFTTSSGFTTIGSDTSNKFYIYSNVSSVQRGAVLNLGSITAAATRTYTLPDSDGTLALTSNITVTALTGNSPITVSGVGTSYAIAINQASSGQNGYLSSTDWTTFNSKQGIITLTTTGTSGAATFSAGTLNIPQYQAALTNPVTGTGTTNYHAKFTGTSTLGNSLIWDNGTNVGIGNTNTTYTFDVTGSGRFTSTLLVGGAATFSSSVTAASGLYNGYTSGLPPTTGSATRGGLRLNNASNIAFDFGTVAAGQAWIQVSDANNYASNFSLLLNPNGGNVGIGTSSPSVLLNVVNSDNSTNSFVAFAAQNLTQQVEIWYGGIRMGGTAAAADLNLASKGSSGNMLFSTNSTERMRITSAGNVLIGQTSASGSVNGIYLRSGEDSGMVSTSDSALSLYRLSTNGKILRFFFGASEVGSISTNTNSLPSDLNFKKDITDLSIGLNLITKLRPVHYRHKLDDENEPLSNGIIAQELEQSLLECGIEKNELLMLQHNPNEDENQSQYWVDYTKMIPILIKSIQELNAKVSALENKS